MKLLVFLIFFLPACGSSPSSDKCDKKAEIDTLAVSTKTYATLGADIDVTATLKDQCPDVDYKGVYALKEAVEPANCTDGDSKVSGAAASWSSLKPATVYFIRACATSDGYTSSGISKSVTTGAAAS